MNLGTSRVYYESCHHDGQGASHVRPNREGGPKGNIIAPCGGKWLLQRAGGCHGRTGMYTVMVVVLHSSFFVIYGARNILGHSWMLDDAAMMMR